MTGESEPREQPQAHEVSPMKSDARHELFFFLTPFFEPFPALKKLEKEPRSTYRGSVMQVTHLPILVPIRLSW